MPEPAASPVDERFKALVAALAREPGVSIGSGRRGFGSDALCVDGRIFAMVTRGSLVLKLPRERVAELLAAGDAAPFDAGKGTPLKEWLMLADAAGDARLDLAREALAFVRR